MAPVFDQSQAAAELVRHHDPALLADQIPLSCLAVAVRRKVVVGLGNGQIRLQAAAEQLSYGVPVVTQSLQLA